MFGRERRLTDGTVNPTTHIFRSQVALSRSYSMPGIRLIQHICGRVKHNIICRSRVEHQVDHGVVFRFSFQSRVVGGLLVTERSATEDPR